MQMLKPKALRKGDTIGLVGISGAMHRPEENFQNMLDSVEALGFKLIVADSCREQYGYLSGTDYARAQGLNQMFADDRVDGIICMRGGYGVARMLDYVDFDVIRANPKALVGYSDITALHTAIHERVHMTTIHGPMPSIDYRTMDAFSQESLMRALTQREPLGLIANPEGHVAQCLVPGRCSGQLVGGNLTLIASACGTPYALDVKDKILLLEDVGEYVYRLDSMLTQLRHAGMFEQCTGIVLGTFTRCPEEYEHYALHLEDVIRDIVLPAGKPVLANLQIGHCPTKITVPLGVECTLDAGARTLEITESPYRD